MIINWQITLHRHLSFRKISNSQGLSCGSNNSSNSIAKSRFRCTFSCQGRGKEIHCPNWGEVSVCTKPMLIWGPVYMCPCVLFVRLVVLTGLHVPAGSVSPPPPPPPIAPFRCNDVLPTPCSETQMLGFRSGDDPLLQSSHFSSSGCMWCILSFCSHSRNRSEVSRKEWAPISRVPQYLVVMSSLVGVTSNLAGLSEIEQHVLLWEAPECVCSLLWKVQVGNCWETQTSWACVSYLLANTY